MRNPVQEDIETTAVSAKPNHSEYFEIRIPKITFRDTPLNAHFLYTLIFFSFLLGMLTNKVIFLETEFKKVKDPITVASANTQTANISPEPTLPQVVTVGTGELPILGSKDAKVTIVEFTDFQCPFCKRANDDALKQIKETYIKPGKVKLAIRHYPLSFHANAQKAQEASECANEQGKFWEYHDVLFQYQETWATQTEEEAANSFTAYAAELGMNTEQFAACLTEEKYKQQVLDDIADAQKVHVDGTPAFFVNGYRITGAQPFSIFEKVIEEELKKITDIQR